jgi:hypothetical protein
MFVIIYVKLSKIWGGKKRCVGGLKKYMHHKFSLLPHTKVPKIEAIL